MIVLIAISTVFTGLQTVPCIMLRLMMVILLLSPIFPDQALVDGVQ
jgi:hypothetical protein